MLPAGLKAWCCWRGASCLPALSAGDPAAGAAADGGGGCSAAGASCIFGQLLGAGSVAALTVAAGTFDRVYESVVATAAAKAGLPFLTALLRGMLCNFSGVHRRVDRALRPSRCRGSWRLCIRPSSPLCCADLSTAWPIFLSAGGDPDGGRYGVAGRAERGPPMWTGEICCR